MVNLQHIRELLESNYEFIECEQEGSDCLRVDHGDNSVWIYENGSTDGLETMSKSIMYFIKRCEGILDV